MTNWLEKILSKAKFAKLSDSFKKKQSKTLISGGVLVLNVKMFLGKRT